MESSATRGFYVTGTDTGVGKTLVSVALLRAYRAQGLSVAGMKPLASGCISTDQGLRNEDALSLQSASDPVPDYVLVNPFALADATAPQIAAAHAGVLVTLPPIIEAYRQLRSGAGRLVVEGVGGWMAPLADGLQQADVASALKLDVILVVGLKLGCLSHARLSERAILADGLRIAGWIGSSPIPAPDFATEYEALMRRELHAPCLGFLPHAPERSASSFATLLRLPDE